MNRINHLLQTHFPGRLPKLNDPSEFMSLELSHLHISSVPFIRQYRDFKDVSHVLSEGRWISKDKYMRMVAKYCHLNRLILLWKYPNGCPDQNIVVVEKLKLFNGDIILLNSLPLKKYQAPAIKNDSSYFVFETFQIHGNVKHMREQFRRLINDRFKMKSIHFNVENNGGGDLIPVHLIMLILCGGRQKWMTPYHVIETRKRIHRKWDPWDLFDDPDNDDYLDAKKLGVSKSDITRPYTGKIHLHVNENCSSSTWYFVTYMIYAFATKIHRKTVKIWGRDLKIGHFESRQLVLHGSSTGTTSGDGNPVFYDNSITIPTQINAERPIKECDWKRFWITI
jgi:hypothetical protein